MCVRLTLSVVYLSTLIAMQLELAFAVAVMHGPTQHFSLLIQLIHVLAPPKKDTPFGVQPV